MIMAASLSDLDFGLRCSAAALLIFHLVNVLSSQLPMLRRWTLALFLGTVLAYLICAHPAFSALDAWLRVPILSLCLMASPVFWLTMQTVFEDDYRITGVKVLALICALALGWMSVAGWGGLPVGLAHKAVVIAFVVATLWGVIKDWRSDLVDQRRRLRTGATTGLAGYLLVVSFVELAYIDSRAPRWLDALQVAGINLAALLLAVTIARRPLEDWLRPSWPDVQESKALPESETVLTAPPPILDRQAALRQRLLHAMGRERAYAREGLSLAQLAAQLDATPAQLRQAINQHLGYRNFNDFLHHYRIDEAAQRLKAQDLPILSIALDVGYGSIGPFNRAFKQRKGLTPSEFRGRAPTANS